MRSLQVDLAGMAAAVASGNAEATFYQKYLSLLTRTGRLKAVKRGRIWWPCPLTPGLRTRLNRNQLGDVCQLLADSRLSCLQIVGCL